MPYAFQAPSDYVSDYSTPDDRYFDNLVQWEHGHGPERNAYAGEGRQQQSPTPQGWVPDLSDHNIWLAEPLTVDPSQSGHWTTERGSNEPEPSSTSPPSSPEQATISVSTAFNAHTSPSPDHPPDFEVLSADDVLFSVSSVMLASASCNGFGYAYPAADTRLRLTESADVLNLVMHAAYGASAAAFAPTLDTLAEAVRRLGAYGMDARVLVAPGAPLFAALRSHAALMPLRVYTLAAQHDLLGLAQVASAHLLGYPLHAMSDAEAEAMGALYMKKLLTLQHNRVSQLAALLEQSQEFHPRTDECDFLAQRKLAGDWTKTAQQVTADGRPDASSAILRDRLAVVKRKTLCADCKAKLDERIWKAVVGWTMLPNTIT